MWNTIANHDAVRAVTAKGEDMTKDQLSAIAVRVTNASALPWVESVDIENGDHRIFCGDSERCILTLDGYGTAQVAANAEFISHAPEDIIEMLGYIRMLERMLEMKV